MRREDLTPIKLARVIEVDSPSLTPEIVEEICQDVRAGASWHSSICKHGFTYKEAGSLYYGNPSLRAQIDRSRALARMAVEVALKHQKPLDWILRGPGRKTEEEQEASFVEESSKVQLETKEPLRVAHAHLHQQVIAPKANEAIDEQTELERYRSMSPEERRAYKAQLEASLHE